MESCKWFWFLVLFFDSVRRVMKFMLWSEFSSWQINLYSGFVKMFVEYICLSVYVCVCIYLYICRGHKGERRQKKKERLNIVNLATCTEFDLFINCCWFSILVRVHLPTTFCSFVWSRLNLLMAKWLCSSNVIC